MEGGLGFFFEGFALELPQASARRASFAGQTFLPYRQKAVRFASGPVLAPDCGFPSSCWFFCFEGFATRAPRPLGGPRLLCKRVFAIGKNRSALFGTGLWVSFFGCWFFLFRGLCPRLPTFAARASFALQTFLPVRQKQSDSLPVRCWLFLFRGLCPRRPRPLREIRLQGKRFCQIGKQPASLWCWHRTVGFLLCCWFFLFRGLCPRGSRVRFASGPVLAPGWGFLAMNVGFGFWLFWSRRALGFAERIIR